MFIRSIRRLRKHRRASNAVVDDLDTVCTVACVGTLTPFPSSSSTDCDAIGTLQSDSATEFQSTVSAVGRGAMIQSHAVPRTTPRVPEPLVHASARPGSAGSLSASPPSRGAHVSRRPPAIGTSFRDSTATSGVTSSSNARLDGAGTCFP